MAQVKCRFHGRFVLAEERVGNVPTGKTTLLAPRIDPSVPHRPLMCAPRDAVSIDPSQTTLAPSFRFATAETAERTEYFAWDLTGCDVEVVSSGRLRMAFVDEVVPLEELEGLLGRQPQLDRRHLKASTSTSQLVSAAIEIQGGVGTATTAFSNSAEFLRADAIGGNPANDRFLRAPVEQADVVEVRLGGASREFRITKENVPSKVTIEIGGFATAVVSFTNFCATLPKNQRYDREFGAYYDLLVNPQADRLIPVVTHLGARADCDVMTRVGYSA